MRVLIVEGSDAICRMIEALVVPRGFEVRSASSGTKGVDEALTWAPNVALVEVELPGALHGLAVCAKLRSERPELPVVMLGEADDEDVKQRAIAAGATAYFAKPFSPLALLKELEALTRRS